MNKSIKLNDKIINDSLPVSTRPYSLKSIFFFEQNRTSLLFTAACGYEFCEPLFSLNSFLYLQFSGTHISGTHTFHIRTISLLLFADQPDAVFFKEKGKNTQIWIGRVCPFYTLSRKAKKIWL